MAKTFFKPVKIRLLHEFLKQDPHLVLYEWSLRAALTVVVLIGLQPVDDFLRKNKRYYLTLDKKHPQW